MFLQPFWVVLYIIWWSNRWSVFISRLLSSVAQSKHQTATTVCRLGFHGGYGDLTSHEQRSISLDGESGEKESRRFDGGGLFRLTSGDF
ncbi:hypothetical protein HanIR_Chr17g0896751 [Helianthus annuus]|nr:hypothetical protein HanIR_Chr17g0896751 [Helianthus annuus]